MPDSANHTGFFGGGRLWRGSTRIVSCCLIIQ